MMLTTTYIQHITLGIQAAVSSSATSSDVSERFDAATLLQMVGVKSGDVAHLGNARLRTRV
jgi:hypothetical protein